MRDIALRPAATIANDPRDLLRHVFGFDEFRPGQEEIVTAALAGEDVLAIMPTGGGKSLCFQLPALMREGLTLVVSPLIALMRDQVAQLVALGVPAASLNSNNAPEETRAAMAAAQGGALKLLYVSPERLARPETVTFLSGLKLAMLAVDEAHCVSQWGHDFRPEYRLIGEVRTALGIAQTLAFTATADAVTRADVAERLFPAPPRVFVGSFDRPNISLAMSPRTDGRRQLLAFLAGHRGESGVVYCQSRRRVEETAAFLRENGYAALAYHAGLDKAERSAAQDAFTREDGVIVVATVAFGMGIDKPDVRFVFHMDLPKNIEGYYQEIGRAGRDGLPAAAHALYGFGEMRQYRQWIDESEASAAQKRIEHDKLTSLVALCEAPRCRRVTLLAYFGEPAEPCGNCDLCAGEIATYDGTIEAQKALSAIVRTRELFGVEHLVTVLRGEENAMTDKHGHARLPTFGVGADRSRRAWRAIYRQLHAAGYTAIDSARYGRWTVTEAGWRVLKGQERVKLREVLETRADRKRKQAATVAETDAPLLAALKALRRRLAAERKVPAYVIFSDRTLIDMAAKAPRDRLALAQVHGVGEKKLTEFGDLFLEAIRVAGTLSAGSG